MKPPAPPVLVFFVLALATSAGAAVPEILPYAGHLEEGGAPYDGNISAVFSLYDDEAAGAELWSESWSSVPVVDGAFVLDLGASAGNPLGADVLDGRVLWLEVSVNGQTLSPRTPLYAAPYAVRATVADAVDGFLPEEHPTFDDLAGARAQVAWATLTEVPAGLADGDDDTHYSAGEGLSLAGTVLSLEDGAVSEAKLADGAVTGAKVAARAITAWHLAAGSVSGAALTDGSVSSAKIVDGSVDTVDLADRAVTSRKIEDASVSAADLAPGAVTSAKIANGTIGAEDLAPSAVTRAALSGAETLVYQAATGCGGGLVVSSACRTSLCSVSVNGNALSLKFYSCAGSCSASSAQTCAGLASAGYLLDDAMAP